MIISIGAEKFFHKIQHQFMIKKKNSPENGHSPENMLQKEPTST